MERSKLENVNDTLLFYLLKYILKDISIEDIINYSSILEDYGFEKVVYAASRKFGLDLYIIDYNYIVATFRLNPDLDFDAQFPNKKIQRPIAKKYGFDIDEFRTEYVRRTYYNTITSYSDELVISTVQAEIAEGDLLYFDGKEVDTDYFDGETTDVKIDRSSIEEVK